MKRTVDNLTKAYVGESQARNLCIFYANVARNEGYKQIPSRFRAILEAERHHPERFPKSLGGLEAGTTFKRSEEIWWICRECGYQHSGKQPSEKCPSCDHPRAFYQLKFEEY